jgi:tetratricopeptide (TPR) repeat protein
MKTAIRFFFMIQFILVPGLANFWPGSAAAQQLSKPKSTIAALLKQARQALAEDRLTLPSGHNAVSYAERVLDLDPDNPQAAQILGDVVKRYNSLGTAAVERAKALQTQELEKAQTFQQRGERVAKQYSVPESAMAPLNKRLAAERASKPALAAERAALRRELAEIAAGYVALGEDALSRGYLEEARRYQIAAKLLLTKPYQLPSNARLESLAERLERMEAKGAMKLPVSTYRPDIFLPPAF